MAGLEGCQPAKQQLVDLGGGWVGVEGGVDNSPERRETENELAVVGDEGRVEATECRGGYRFFFTGTWKFH